MDQAGSKPKGRPRASHGAGRSWVRLAARAAVFGLVVAAGAFGYAAALSKARTTQAVEDIREIEQRALTFALATGDLPSALDVIGWRQLDPWGGPYEYLVVQRDGRGRGGESAGQGDRAGRRKDRRSRDLNTDFDLCSRGPDGATHPQLGSPEAEDDIVRAANGGFVGVAAQYEGR